MNNIKLNIMELLREETGVTSIEYALIASLIAIAIVGGVTILGDSVQGMYEYVLSEITQALSQNE
jgi:pilus assembly protein Flp/PilA